MERGGKGIGLGKGGSHGPDVYQVGTLFREDEPAVAYAALWLNGVARRISDNDSEAFAVFVSNRDVYVAGYESDCSWPEYATLWKNGVALRLRKFSCATSVFVSGDDVYVAGTTQSSDGIELNKEPDSTDLIEIGIEPPCLHLAMLWKNGAPQFLPPSQGGLCSFAEDVFVSGSDVYVAGWEADFLGGSDRQNAVLWKNGVPQVLPPSPGYDRSKAWDVFASGADVYVSGRERAGRRDTYRSRPAQWKNGVPDAWQMVKQARYYDSASAPNGDVYLVGVEGVEDDCRATVWKNGAPQRLSEKISSADRVFVLDDDVYVIGSEGDYGDPSHWTLWKNGAPQRTWGRDGDDDP
jgi:hypothetical protein